MKADLNSTCKDASMILEIQKMVFHITQVVYAESMSTSYFYLDQVSNKQVSVAITHNLVCQIFSLST
jgi:hypothetical protein